MKIWDTFMLNDELDMLQMRLEHLADSPVYRHVLVEAPFDHQGHPKPLYYADNAELFGQFSDKIIHVVAKVPGPDDSLNPWVREQTQRQHVWKGLAPAGVSADDYLLLCDVDEIPSPAGLAPQRQMSALEMDLAMFAVDWLCPQPTRVAVAGPVHQCARAPLGILRDNASRAAMALVKDAGWHFTWLGGPAAIKAKADYFCHLELRDLILEGNEAGEWYEEGWTWHTGEPPYQRRFLKMLPAEVSQAWPRYIYERRCPPSWFRPRPID